MSLISKNLKSFSTVFSGAVTAQLVSFLFAPIIARLFTTNDFGVTAFFFVIVSVLTPACTLKYNQAILLPKDDDEANELIKINSILMTIFALFILLCIVLLKHLTNFSFALKLGNLIYLIPLALFINCGLTVIRLSCVRWKKFKSIALGSVLDSILTPVVRITGGFFAGSSVLCLLISRLVSQTASVTLLIASIRDIAKINYADFNKKKITGLLKEYKEFPLYTFPAANLVTLTNNLTLLVFGFFYSPHLLGILAMTRRLVSIPSRTISDSLRTVLIPQFVEKKNNNQSLLKTCIKVFSLLFITGIIPFGIIFFFGESLFVFYLGEKWLKVGRYAVLLIPAMFSQYLCAPVHVIFLALRLQKIKLYIQIIFLSATSAALILSAFITHNPEVTLISYSITVSAINLISIFIAFCFVINFDRKL